MTKALSAYELFRLFVELADFAVGSAEVEDPDTGTEFDRLVEEFDFSVAEFLQVLFEFVELDH